MATGLGFIPSFSKLATSPPARWSMSCMMHTYPVHGAAQLVHAGHDRRCNQNNKPLKVHCPSWQVQRHSEVEWLAFQTRFTHFQVVSAGYA